MQNIYDVDADVFRQHNLHLQCKVLYWMGLHNSTLKMDVSHKIK